MTLPELIEAVIRLALEAFYLVLELCIPLTLLGIILAVFGVHLW